MEEICKEIERQIRDDCNGTEQMQDRQIEEMIDTAILEKSKQEFIPLKDKLWIREQVYHSIRGYDCLDRLLEQEDITEIMINGYDSIFIERNGKLEEWKHSFSSEEKYMDVIQQIVAGCNRIVNESSPIVDARLSDGSRVNVVLPPIALNGAVMTIRRFPKETYGMRELIALNMLSVEMADLLRLLVECRYNILISGGTGSGKTTFLNALSNYIPSHERIITIEDSAELQICGIPNLVRLEVRNANVEGKNEIPMKELIRSALRMRPDRIIVGEVRGEEAVDMLQAMNTGHSGSLSTGHANSARDMLYRLETMVLMGMDIPLTAIRQQIASAIDVIVHIGRLPDGSRSVLEIAEIKGMVDGEIMIHSLYQYKGWTVRETDDREDKENRNGEACRKERTCIWKQVETLEQEEKLNEAGKMEEYQKIFIT